jgi:hypothetical protein
MGSSPPSKSRLKLRRAGRRGASASRLRYRFQMKWVALPMPGENSWLPPKSSVERLVVRIPFRNLLARSSPEPDKLMDRSAKYLKNLVGAPGFEPGASCAQGRRATRLRYAPTVTALFILKHFPTLLLIRVVIFGLDWRPGPILL